MDKYPIIKIVTAFCFGIILQQIFSFSLLYIILIFVFTLFILVISVFVKNSKIQITKSIAIFLFSFLLGITALAVQKMTIAKFPFNLPKIRNENISGTINDINLIEADRITIKVNLTEINGKSLNNKNSIYLCRFWKDTLNNVEKIYDEIKIGNKIKFVGTILEPKGQRNPGEFDYKNYLNINGISGIINCYDFDGLEIIDKNFNYILNSIFEIRRSIDNKIKQIYTEEYAGFIKGIFLADRSDISQDLQSEFINSGVIHVLAVSGLHVGFIAFFIFALSGRIELRYKYYIAIAGIILFLIITKGVPSVFRASVMAIIIFTAKLSGRSTNGINSLSIAAFIILLLNPLELFNPGFLLSFSAVLSILIIFPMFSNAVKQLKINKYLKNILIFASVSIAAQIGTLPFTLYYFNKLSIISILANIIVIPIIGINVATGIISIIIGYISIPFASVFAEANMFLISLNFLIVKILSELNFSHLDIFNFSIYDGLIFYFTILLIFIFLKYLNGLKKFFAISFAVLVSLFLYKLDNISILPKNELTILAIDVGQGDSFLVKFPNDKIALIDAGNFTDYFDCGKYIIYPLLQRLGIDKIDYAFISHLDSDHFGGSIYLIDQNLIGKLYKPKIHNDIKDKTFEDFLDSNNMKYFSYSDTTFNIGKTKITFFNDTTKLNSMNLSSNDNSGIIKIEYGKNSFLFVGDAELEMEEFLIENYSSELQSDVLKIGHHGSKSSTSDEFLNLVNPKIALISAGIMNKFKHPSNEVIRRLEQKQIEILRTDLNGAVILSSDGNEIKNIDWRSF